MIKRLLFFAFFISMSVKAFSITHDIYNSGNTYAPANIQINLGDTVFFGLSILHDARQVSFATWSANDTTQLPGGFDLDYGGGYVIPTSLGMIYFVCTPDVQSMGMKGTILVSQLGVEENKSITMQIMQSVAEQNLKLVVNGGTEGKMHVEMLNLSGQIVKTITLNVTGDESTTTLMVSDMPKGVYMLRWSYANINKARKIILH